MLVSAGPDLIDDDSQHEDQVDAEGPEQDSLGAGEFAAGAVVEDFGGGELVGFEGGDNCGGVFGSDCGVGDGGGIALASHIQTISKSSDVKLISRGRGEPQRLKPRSVTPTLRHD